MSVERLHNGFVYTFWFAVTVYTFWIAVTVWITTGMFLVFG